MSFLWTAMKLKRSLDSLGETPVSDDGEIKGDDTDSLVTKFKTLPFALAVLAVVGVAVVVMISSALIVIDFSSTLIIALGVLAVWQKERLFRLGGMRGNINKLRSMVNEMTLENDKLTDSNDRLDLENQELSYVTKDIESLAETMGCGVNRLIDSIEEMKEIHEQMNHCLEIEVMQQVIDIGLKSDSDQDFTINSPRELKRLEQRLSNIPGIVFDKENFRKITKYDDEESPGISLHDIMRMFRNLKDPTISDKDNIFLLRPEASVEKEYIRKRDTGVYARKRASQVGTGTSTGSGTPTNNNHNNPVGAATEAVKSWFSSNKQK